MGEFVKPWLRNTNRVFLSIMLLFAIGMPLFQAIRARLDSNVKSVSVFCNRGILVNWSIDLATNELEGVFLVESFKKGGVPNPPTSATSVKSEIIGNQQKSLGTYEWTLFKQEGTAALPKFTFRIPKDIKEKRLNFAMTAE